MQFVAQAVSQGELAHVPLVLAVEGVVGRLAVVVLAHHVVEGLVGQPGEEVGEVHAGEKPGLPVVLYW